MADFYIKQGDTRPVIQAKLYNDSSEVDLTGCTVRFLMGDVVAAAATVTSVLTGAVQYQWATADTADAGSFDGEFEVTFTDGRIETYPNNGYLDILITEQIA